MENKNLLPTEPDPEAVEAQGKKPAFVFNSEEELMAHPRYKGMQRTLSSVQTELDRLKEKDVLRDSKFEELGEQLADIKDLVSLSVPKKKKKDDLGLDEEDTFDITKEFEERKKTRQSSKVKQTEEMKGRADKTFKDIQVIAKEAGLDINDEIFANARTSFKYGDFDEARLEVDRVIIHQLRDKASAVESKEKQIKATHELAQVEKAAPNAPLAKGKRITQEQLKGMDALEFVKKVESGEIVI